MENCTTININIYGGNNQILPNANVGIQNCTDNEKKQDEEKDRSTPLDKYFKDKDMCNQYIKRISKSHDAVFLCKQVLMELYEDVFADTVDGDKTLKSEAFLSDIQKLVTFQKGTSIRNLQAHIDKYIFSYKMANKKLSDKKNETE